MPDDPQVQKRGGREYKRRRVLGLAPWKPQGRTLALVKAIDGVLAEYRAYWPLTARQVYYRLLGLGLPIPKTKGGADGVGDKLNRGRRAGRWPWEAIRDEGAVRSTVGGGYDGPAQFWSAMRRMAERYPRNLHTGQPQRVIVWCEAAGMVPQIERACAGLPVLVRSGGGEPSLTLLHEQAQEMVDADRPTVVLYIGDLDEHGLVIEDRVADELVAFTRDLGEPGVLSFRTIAITQEQTHGLPDNPEKPGEFQAEALPPDVLAQIVREAVESEVDLDTVAQAQAEEEVEREDLLDLLARMERG